MRVIVKKLRSITNRIYKEEYKSYAKSLGRWEEQVRLVEVGKKLEEGLYEYVVVKGNIENSIYISPYKVMNMTSGKNLL